MSWLNTLERGFGYTFVDSAAGDGQIWLPTNRTNNSRLRARGDDFNAVCVDSPVLRRRRLATPDNEDLVPVVGSVNCSVKNVWRVVAFNTLTGRTEYLFIPCADPSLLPAGTDEAQLTVAPFADLVQGLEEDWNRFDSANQGPMQISKIRYEGVFP